MRDNQTNENKTIQATKQTPLWRKKKTKNKSYNQEVVGADANDNNNQFIIL